ncbi:GntR family transcriptional regulator [Sporosarcina sp. FA9]|uniref:GntR family transcriptional regulator n=1 Tax=Sporosarcina sp. FA9 TaxID=3413030 RepID=UPI003F65832C
MYLVLKKNDLKIKRTFMRDQVYDILQEWIVIGKLEPGAKLRDQELSDILGISRTPIREALLRLEDDGLVITKANRWTLVSPIDIKEAENIYLIVKALEILAIGQGFPNLSEKDIVEIEKLNENFKTELEHDNKVAAFQADNEFHDKIVQLSENIELSKLLINLKIKIQRMEIYYFSLENNSLESYNEHVEIIDALKANNLTRVIAAIRANWENSLNRIVQKIN